MEGNMKSKRFTNEKRPLLNMDDSPGRKPFINERLFSNMTFDDTTIITRGRPGSTLMCSFIKIASVLLVFFFLIGLAAFFSFLGRYSMEPKCRKGSRLTNKHKVTVHLVRNPSSWCTNQLRALEKIVDCYPQRDIELVLIENATEYGNEGGIGSDEGRSTEVAAFSCDAATFYANVKKASRRHLQKVKTHGRYWYMKEKRATGVGNEFHEIWKQGNSSNSLNVNRTDINTIQDFLKVHPNVKVVNSTFEKIFQSSPLSKTWKNLNLLTMIFAARLVKLWEEGGISFALLDHVLIPSPIFDEELYSNLPNGYKNCTSKNPCDTSNYTHYNSNSSVSNKTSKNTPSNIITSSIRNFMEELMSFYGSSLPTDILERHPDLRLIEEVIELGNKNFEKTGRNVATVDGDGVYMMTKFPCHEFIGDLILSLQRSNRNVNYRGVMADSMAKYCTRVEVLSS